MDTHTHIFTYIHAHSYLHRYISIHTHTHTFTHIYRSRWPPAYGWRVLFKYLIPQMLEAVDYALGMCVCTHTHTHTLGCAQHAGECLWQACVPNVYLTCT